MWQVGDVIGGWTVESKYDDEQAARASAASIVSGEQAKVEPNGGKWFVLVR